MNDFIDSRARTYRASLIFFFNYQVPTFLFFLTIFIITHLIKPHYDSLNNTFPFINYIMLLHVDFQTIEKEILTSALFFILFVSFLMNIIYSLIKQRNMKIIYTKEPQNINKSLLMRFIDYQTKTYIITLQLFLKYAPIAIGSIISYITISIYISNKNKELAIYIPVLFFILFLIFFITSIYLAIVAHKRAKELNVKFID